MDGCATDKQDSYIFQKEFHSVNDACFKMLLQCASMDGCATDKQEIRCMCTVRVRGTCSYYLRLTIKCAVGLS